jgi:hypothetical protein
VRSLSWGGGCPRAPFFQGRGELRDQQKRTGSRSGPAAAADLPSEAELPSEAQRQPFCSFHSACALFSWSASESRNSFALVCPSITFWKAGSLSAFEIVFQSGR